MFNRFNFKVKVNTEVTKIFRNTKEVEILDRLTKKVTKDSYDKLVLSPGAEPFRPPIPGYKPDSKRIFTLRNVPDTDKIKKFVDELKPKHAVIVGGGFIGLVISFFQKFIYFQIIF